MGIYIVYLSILSFILFIKLNFIINSFNIALNLAPSINKINLNNKYLQKLNNMKNVVS